MTGFHVKFDSCKSGAILPTVMLLLHKEVQLFHPVKGSSVFIDVIFQRLQETHNGNTATQELPDMLATFSGEQLREYLGSKVAAMTEGLLIKSAQDRAKQKGRR